LPETRYCFAATARNGKISIRQVMAREARQSRLQWFCKMLISRPFASVRLAPDCSRSMEHIMMDGPSYFIRGCPSVAPLLLHLLLFPTPVASGDDRPSENLPHLVFKALVINPELKASDARWEIYSNKIAQALSFDDPMLNLAIRNGVLTEPFSFGKEARLSHPSVQPDGPLQLPEAILRLAGRLPGGTRGARGAGGEGVGIEAGKGRKAKGNKVKSE
jgi:hypothetical protein